MTLRGLTLVRTLLLAGLGAVLALAYPPPAAMAETRASVAVEFFQDELGPDGYWVDDRHYGAVWYPSERPDGWQPYTEGRWVWTSEYGWYWESDEPWGWATYHYGRWVLTPEHGWVWVPGEDWGPAWVEWRYGDGHVGWAPMPPEVDWRDDQLVYARVDVGAPRYHGGWVFVAESDFASDAWRARRVPSSRNAAMIRASASTTSYASVDGRIVNRSIDVARLSAAARVRIRATPVMHSDVVVRGRAAGHVSIYRPRIAAKAKLILDAPEAEAAVGLEDDSYVGSRSDVEARSESDAAVRGSVDGSVGGGGGGLGVGIGGGGGLRIGR